MELVQIYLNKFVYMYLKLLPISLHFFCFWFYLKSFPDPDLLIECGSGSRRGNVIKWMRIHIPGHSSALNPSFLAEVGKKAAPALIFDSIKRNEISNIYNFTRFHFFLSLSIGIHSCFDDIKK